MNIENLEVGQIYKNYKVLCETLEIEPMGGTVKKANIKELERFANYHKDGIKFIIDEIYDKPKTKVIPTIYGEELDTLILDLLAKNLKSGRRKVILGKQKLLIELAMINDNYFYGMRNSESFSKVLEIDKKYVDDFFNISYSKLKSSLISSFKRLASRSLLSWKEVICIVTKNGLILANENQERWIMSIEYLALKQLRCKNRGEVVLKKLWEKFIDTINQIIINEEYKSYPEFKGLESINNYKFHYRAYQINFIDYVMDEHLLKIDDRKETKFKLNQKIVVHYKESNQKRYTKYKNKCEENYGEVLNKNMELKISNDYVKNSDLLVDKCINRVK